MSYAAMHLLGIVIADELDVCLQVSIVVSTAV